MFNVLVIDDNVKRSNRLKNSLVVLGIQSNQITLCHSLNSGKDKLAEFDYDLVVIDIVLPRRDGDKRLINDAGISLLQEIKRRKKYKLPQRIIGITSNLEHHPTYSEEFSKLCELVIPVEFNSECWIEKILTDVSYRLNSKFTRRSMSSEKVLVSIHGIRTFGEWQNRLNALVDSKQAGFTKLNYSYGYLDVLSFLIPFLRWRTVNRLHDQLKYWMEVNSAQQFYFVAHSFGTYILVKAIEKIIKKKIPCNIKCVILCGSVLKSSYSWDKCRSGRDFLVINECGTHDFVLWLSHLFAPLLGMAGKTGFKWLNSEVQINRYHAGGHSLYFEEDRKPSDKFMVDYWLPILIDDEMPVHIDKRMNNIFHHGLIEMIINHTGKIIYPSLFLIAGWVMYFA